jgi:hypothetical protein
VDGSDGNYVTAYEAAADPELFDGAVTGEWVLAEARKGRIPSYKFSPRNVKFDRADVRAYIERARRSNIPAAS